MYLILGLARTGLSTAKFLRSKGIDFIVWDDDVLRRDRAKNAGYTLFNEKDFAENDGAEKTLLSAITKIILSPGMPRSHPMIQNIPGGKVMTDTELFQNFTTHGKFIGITGTNGKSTTTALVTHTLKHLGIHVYMGGNIGIPVFDLPLDGEVYVIELSSFQLERAGSHALDVACWINFASDHLVEHGTLDDYFKAKERIFERAHVKIYGMNDAYPEKYKGEGGIQITHMDPFFKDYVHPYLKGKHNLENIMTAFYAVRSVVPQTILNEDILKAMDNFEGLTHRQQYIGIYENMTFINDSKATSAAATEMALAAYDNIYWILGGQEKPGGIVSLAPYFHKIRKAFAFGSAGSDFASFLKEHGVEVVCFETLKDVMEMIFLHRFIPSQGQSTTLLFSPACASFDQYRDFEERGEHFMRLVAPLFDTKDKAPLLAPLLQSEKSA